LKAFLNDVKLNWSLCTGTDERLIYEPFTHLDAASREAIQTRVSFGASAVYQSILTLLSRTASMISSKNASPTSWTTACWQT
jgi:hypothetical protein